LNLKKKELQPRALYKNFIFVSVAEVDSGSFKNIFLSMKLGIKGS